MKFYHEGGVTYWEYAIKKDVESSFIESHCLEFENNTSLDYNNITCYLVFGVKFDSNRKGVNVTGGHLTDPIFDDLRRHGQSW